MLVESQMKQHVAGVRVGEGVGVVWKVKRVSLEEGPLLGLTGSTRQDSCSVFFMAPSILLCIFTTLS